MQKDPFCKAKLLFSVKGAPIQPQKRAGGGGEGKREERIFDIFLLPCLSDAGCIFQGLTRQEGRQKWEYDYKEL